MNTIEEEAIPLPHYIDLDLLPKIMESGLGIEKWTGRIYISGFMRAYPTSDDLARALQDLNVKVQLILQPITEVIDGVSQISHRWEIGIDEAGDLDAGAGPVPQYALLEYKDLWKALAHAYIDVITVRSKSPSPKD